MRETQKTKQQLMDELAKLRQQLSQLQASTAKPCSTPAASLGSSHSETQMTQLQMAGTNLEWNLKEGTCNLENAPFALMWLDTTVAGLMAGIQAMVGSKRFALVLENEGRKSINNDWQIISQFEDFQEGFAALAGIAKIAGWGNWQLQSINRHQQECRFQITNSWEGRYQKAIGVCWGSAMLAGKLAGLCSKLFNTNCWAEQTAFIGNGDEFDEFVVRPSNGVLEPEIEQLQETGEATHADMTVTLQKLHREIQERQRVEEQLRHSEEALLKAKEELEIRVEERTAQLRKANEKMQREIAEREVTQEALQKSEARNRAFLQAIPDLMLRLSKDGTYLDVRETKEVCALVPPSEVIGKNLHEIVPAELAGQYHEAIRAALQTGNTQILEYELPGSGTIYHYEARIVASGEDEVLTIVRDIGQRKRVETQLQQQAQREALLNRLANQIRNSLDLDTILQTAVTEIRNLLQIDRCHFIWFRPDSETPEAEVVTEDRNPGLPAHTGCYPLEQVRPFFEQFRKLEALRTDDVTTISDTIMREFLINFGFTSLLAIPLQLQGGEIGVVSCGNHSHIRPWQDSEVELLHAVLDQLAIAIDQAHLYAQSRAAAEQAQAQAQQIEQTLYELKLAQTHLIQSEKMSSLGQLVAGVAHEINNPVNFIYGNLSHAKDYTSDILGLLQTYQKTYPNSTSEIQEESEAIELDFIREDLPRLMDSMQVGADRIRDIVLSLRNFSRLDEAEMKAVDIHDGLDSTLMILQNRLKNKSDRPAIEIIKEYGSLPLVECYAGQLNQVFMNILSNAIDALDEYNQKRTWAEIQTNPAKITIHTSLNIESYSPSVEEKKLTSNSISNPQKSTSPEPSSLTAQNSALRTQHSIAIRIIDNGPGMPEKTRQQLFNPFFTTKPVGKGTGLGLAISHSIVAEKHGGQLTCNSSPGKGAEFVIQIPLRR
ncbi:MAG: GAF domain-containing protein [Microcoleus vaginatus WJT46-NPBG5]|jgi:PAS domain S-box-containing protein|nr:GAF domain-containing protein [Microcoleus vaginatus WJT46-NPBG5]